MDNFLIAERPYTLTNPVTLPGLGENLKFGCCNGMIFDVNNFTLGYT